MKFYLNKEDTSSLCITFRRFTQPEKLRFLAWMQDNRPIHEDTDLSEAPKISSSDLLFMADLIEKLSPHVQEISHGKTWGELLSDSQYDEFVMRAMNEFLEESCKPAETGLKKP